MSTIQIKRSTVTAIPSSVSNGELAYTSNGGVLYIGDPANDTVMAIGGLRVPGTLTANQALVTNSTSGINQIQVANLVLTGTAGGIYANGGIGSAGYVLFSGGAGANNYWGTAGATGVNTLAQYSWSNTQTFTNTITFSSVIDVGSNVKLNTTQLMIGNSTVNTTVNSTIFTGISLIANNSSYLGGTIASGYQLNATLAANVATMTSNNSTHLNGTPSANFVQNADSRTLSGNLTFSGANIVISGTNTNITSNTLLGGTNTSISSNLTVTSSLITATSANLSVQNINVSGNLIISGSLVSVNASHLVVNDNFIEIADNNLTTDAVDAGLFSPAGNSTVIWYSGIARIASLSKNNNPTYWIFSSNTNPNTSTTIDTSSNTATGTLKSFLTPWGAGGAFVVNTSAINIVGNSTVSVTINANTLTTTTALPITSGGTGLNSVTANTILVGNSAAYTPLAIGTTGQLLQVSAAGVIWGMIDGGTF